jgi:hypothetical protein
MSNNSCNVVVNGCPWSCKHQYHFHAIVVMDCAMRCYVIINNMNIALLETYSFDSRLWVGRCVHLPHTCHIGYGQFQTASGPHV